MAHSLLVAMFMIFIVSAPLLSRSEGRKLLGTNTVQVEKNKIPLKPSLVLTALPKGKVPSSAPSKKGHAVVVDEKLIARQLASLDRVLLRSVPSPGMGH